MDSCVPNAKAAMQGLADVIGFDTMFKMFAQSLNTCRYNLPWNKEAPEIMVSSDVVYNKPEIRRKCIGPATHTWFGQLSNSVELAS